MLNIIKADFYRLTKTKGFYLYWILTIVISAITIIMKQPGGINVGSVGFIDTDNTLDVSQMSANFTFYYLMLFNVFGIVVSEFSEMTVKNTISSAVSRKMYYIAKFTFTEIYVLVSFVIANVGFYVVNRIVNNDKEYYTTFGHYMKLFVRQLPIMAGACAVVILLAFVVKRAATFNALTLLFPLIYTTILMIGLSDKGENIFSTLLKYELATQLGWVVSDPTSSYLTNCTLLGFGVVVVSFVVGYITFNKFELN